MKLLISTFFATLIFSGMTVKHDSISPQSINQDQRPLFTFGIIADVQYCDCDPAGTRFYRSSLDKLREAAVSFREEPADFIINLGDIIERDFGSYKPVLDILDSCGIKSYHVTGNHDYSVVPGLKKMIPLFLPSKNGYYSFVNNRYRFIFLNGNEISKYFSDNEAAIREADHYITEMKNKGEINAIDWNGGISGKQLGWLKGQLDDASRNYEKVFIICHFPVVPDNIHNLLNYKEVLPLLEKYNNIIAWFSGHNHAGNYGNINMTHFVTFKGMVETDTSNSFALVEVYADKIQIRGYGREKSRLLAF